MSYYDFEHFWYPDQVCGQKSLPKSKSKIATEIKKFISELLGKDWDDCRTDEISSDRNLINSQESEPENTNLVG